jgi:hypothetical protein
MQMLYLPLLDCNKYVEKKDIINSTQTYEYQINRLPALYIVCIICQQQNYSDRTKEDKLGN